ncbi:hypothetical protein [Endozoicomonas sp. SCSIO W0465]|uniref:hypothetical protein n=1 Tax=Endozoicomonas sp. SCSIO W0465 TaxID=2918516 RepID=UPI0020757FEF|nr:hypothetical protein [Endozoicomonas sp. SCSIO W0465]USE38417.1 hypothetical protein MJO57_09745 [Endozoicomonas sp. SCSIO W0465]
MLTPANKSINNCQFHAFLRDEQYIVTDAFSRRIQSVKTNDDLIIKRVDDRPDMTTYDIFRRKTRSDMDSDEQCRMTLLPSPVIESSSADRALTIEPVEKTWFTEAAKVSVRDRGGVEKSLGILLMVNPDNVHLIKHYLCMEDSPEQQPEQYPEQYPEQQEEGIFQLLEMLPATCRQHHLYSHYGIKGLPKPAAGVDVSVASDSDPTLGHWPLLDGLGEKYITPVSGLLKNVLQDISSLTGTIASMHEQGVAHGDIRLKNLRIIDGQLGPGNTERFSVVGECSGTRQSGEKRFIFYNNAWHAPELRFPGAYAGTRAGFASWQYVAASKEGDIWSYGLLLAVMICHITGGEEVLCKAGILQQSLADYMKSSNLYKSDDVDRAVANEAAAIQKAGYGTRYLSEPKGLLKLNLPTMKKAVSGAVETELSDGDKKKLCQLVALVERCTDIDPKQRPTAKKVLEGLYVIMEKKAKGRLRN